MKKRILLLGFNKSQISLLNKKFGKNIFLTSLKDFNKANALISFKRYEFEKIINNNLISKFSCLEWIHLPGAGIENYLFFKELNKTKFTNGKIIQGNQVADHAIALLLSLTRKISFISKYGQDKPFDFRPIELNNKRALIVGFGGIGKCIADRAYGFGLKLDAISYEFDHKNRIIENFYLLENLNEAVSKADVIFISAPLTNKTENLFNSKIFKKMKKNSILINISRGKIVCNDSLIKALNEKKLLGVGLDVTYPETLNKNHKLHKMDNVIITPHIAGISQNFTNSTLELIIKNINRYLNNLDLINLVDINKGY